MILIWEEFGRQDKAYIVFLNNHINTRITKNYLMTTCYRFMKKLEDLWEIRICYLSTWEWPDLDFKFYVSRASFQWSAHYWVACFISWVKHHKTLIENTENNFNAALTLTLQQHNHKSVFLEIHTNETCALKANIVF